QGLDGLGGILRDTNGTRDIVCCAKRQDAKRQATFSDMSDDAADQSIAASCNGEIDPSLLPGSSLSWKAIKGNYRDTIRDIDVVLSQEFNGLGALHRFS